MVMYEKMNPICFAGANMLAGSDSSTLVPSAVQWLKSVTDGNVPHTFKAKLKRSCRCLHSRCSFKFGGKPAATEILLILLEN